MSMIRAARSDDIAAIAAIWNPLIRDTDITFNPVEKTPDALATYLDEHDDAGDPVLVVEQNGAVVGFASYHAFRSGPGYARTKEVSVSLAPDSRGKGHGKNLLQSLESKAKSKNIHALVAGITETNTSSRKFFTTLGYVEVGVMPEVGRKFDRWHNLVLMQKIL